MVSSATELRVKELLREKRWTTKMLAEKTGMSESYLTHIKNRTRRWNEDTLKRLAEAFESHPIELFSNRKKSVTDRKERFVKKDSSEYLAPSLAPKIVPVMKEIPAHPSPYTNQVTQMTTGCKDLFVPVMGCTDPDMFCVKLDVNTFKPELNKGDYLIVSPAAEIFSGDLVAVEYGDTGRQMRQFMQISYAEGFIILESPSRKQAPIALSKSKDAYRIIGKVIYRYQKVD